MVGLPHQAQVRLGECGVLMNARCLVQPLLGLVAPKHKPRALGPGFGQTFLVIFPSYASMQQRPPAESFKLVASALTSCAKVSRMCQAQLLFLVQPLLGVVAPKHKPRALGPG